MMLHATCSLSHMSHVARCISRVVRCVLHAAVARRVLHVAHGMLRAARRAALHVASGGSIYRADIAIGTYNEYVAQTASTTIDELIVSAHTLQNSSSPQSYFANA